MGKKDDSKEEVLDVLWAIAKGVTMGLVISGVFMLCIKATRHYMSKNDNVIETVELLRHRVDVIEIKVDALDRRLDADERLLDAKTELESSRH